VISLLACNVTQLLPLLKMLSF